MDTKRASHKLSVKVLVHDNEGRVLLIRRSEESNHNRGKWDLPGGKVNPGEDFDKALLREVKEETGLTIELTEPLGTCQYQMLDGAMVVFLIIGGRCVGGEVRLSAEHDAFKWAHLNEINDNDISGQFRAFLTTYVGENAPISEQRDEPIDAGWLDRQVDQYKEEQPKYELLATVLRKVLEKARDRHASRGLVQTREKEIQSFAEKAVRKQAKYRDPLKAMTDLAGGRIVTYTMDEADAVCRWIENEPGITIDRVNSLNTKDRLKTAEFGYIARHYVVQLTGPDVLGFDITPGLRRLKCEVQVATFLQHVWAAIGHDRIYKTMLKVPEEIKRRAAEVAALLESADDAFRNVIVDLDKYQNSFDPYLTPRELDSQIERLYAVYRTDPDGPGGQSTLLRLGRLLVAAGRAAEAYEVMSKLSAVDKPDLQRDLGRSAHTAGNLVAARSHLERAAHLEPEDPITHLFWGDTYCSTEPAKALPHYAEAHRLSPEEPRVLVPLVECELRVNRDDRILRLMRGSFEAGIKESKQRSSIGVNMPQVLLQRGRLNLYREPGAPFEALTAYAEAALSFPDSTALDQELQSLQRITESLAEKDKDTIGSQPSLLIGLSWSQSFLQLVITAKQMCSTSKRYSSNQEFGAATEDTISREWLSALASPEPERPNFTEPIVIVAGGCDDKETDYITQCEADLRLAFEGFKGTVICGGTTAGISGLIARLLGGRDGIQLLGYLPTPDKMPKEDHVDDVYRIIHTKDDGYGPLGSIQTWADLIVSGIPPQDIRVLGINGGRLAAFECRLGLALGAVAGVVQETGRQAEHLLTDPFWNNVAGFAPLPRDWAVFAAFIRGAITSIESRAGRDLPHVDLAAKSAHSEYRRTRLTAPGAVPANLLPWAKLPEDLKQSNREQAAYAIHIVRSAGFDIASARPDDDFPPPMPEGFMDRLENMAQMEHGRYVVERMSSGWRLGDTNDAVRKTNPTLVAWNNLSNRFKKYDRDAVLHYGYVLWQAGLKIVKRSD